MDMPKVIRKKIINEDDLKKIRVDNLNKKIVFCSGCFDVLHSGHIFALNEYKKLGDILVVGVGRDSIIRKLKDSGRPINPENNRLFLISNIQSVDYALLNQDFFVPGKIDFSTTLKLLQPDIFAINEDNEFLNEHKELCNKFNIDLKIIKKNLPENLTPISTTRIIQNLCR